VAVAGGGGLKREGSSLMGQGEGGDGDPLFRFE
jgi:hypothetical protein